MTFIACKIRKEKIKEDTGSLLFYMYDCIALKDIMILVN